MLNHFLGEFSDKLNYFKKNKTKIIISILLLIFLMICLGFKCFNLGNLMGFNYKNEINFFFFSLRGGLFFLLNLIINLKNEFIYFFFSLIPFILNDFSVNNIYKFNLNFFYNIKYSNHIKLSTYYDYYFYMSELNYFFFKNTITIRSLTINTNLPIFFIFGFLFLITTLSSLVFLSFLGLYGAFFINLISIIIFWISSIIYFNSFFLDNYSFYFNLGKWFVISFNKTVYFDFLIDSISYSFMFLTLTIAVFVYIYAFSYFRYEPNVERLILLINCFVISMIILVTSGNLFVLFLGWELIGLTSFFLINFWSTRISTLKAAFKAFIFNKFSDVSLLIGILIIYFYTNDLNILIINNNIHFYNNYYINILNFDIPVIEITSFFFIMCAFVKSAQFGFHLWLPDSMEAPVPASALIHSATLVSAGVFLLLRISPMFEYSIFSSYFVPIIGSFTAFFGGLCSVYQSDIKKILAYSTISHCGFLMVCYNTQIVEYTILYLYIHGFFKASVFLCVGNIIRFSRNYQDFRKMGGFYKLLPFECFSSFICLINLCGLPFTLGFYIKHLLVIGVNLNNFFIFFFIINILGGAVSGLIYSYRLFYYVFFDFKKGKKIIYNQSNRKVLKSFFYTNTTLASNISIFFLIFFSYLISLYMFNIFLNSSSLSESLNIHSLNLNQYEEFIKPLLTTINNISFFNWILLLVIFSIIIISWRFVNNFDKIISFLSYIVIFIIFFYLFYNILTI